MAGRGVRWKMDQTDGGVIMKEENSRERGGNVNANPDPRKVKNQDSQHESS